jgi:heterodisulfide reductase subunit C
MALSRLTDKDKVFTVAAEQCSQCGKCSSGCPAARFLDFRPRKITLMAQRDQVDDIVDTEVIWWCTQCHQCMERCPREVSPYDIIIYLQNLAVERGINFPKDLNMLMNGVKRNGVIQLPQDIMDKDFEDYDRDSLGLPPFKGPSDLEAMRRGLEKIMEKKK